MLASNYISNSKPPLENRGASRDTGGKISLRGSSISQMKQSTSENRKYVSLRNYSNRRAED
jgi:hypothetical protein